MRLNCEKIKSYHFENHTGYIPLILLEYIPVDDYFNNISEDVFKEFVDSRCNLQMSCPDYNSYLEYDLNLWLEDNPEYEDIKL